MIDESNWINAKVSVDLDVEPELAQRLVTRLRELIVDAEGEDEIPEDASLGWLVARALDRQYNPFAELQALAAESDDQYHWFGRDKYGG